MEATLTDKLVRLRSANNVLGRAIVIHDGEDDLGLGGDEGKKSILIELFEVYHPSIDQNNLFNLKINCD